MPRRTRRQVLAALAAAGLAGCSALDGSAPSTEAPGSSPSSTPSTEAPEVSMMTDYNTEAWQTRWEQTVVPAVEANTGVTLDVRYLGLAISHEKRQRVTEQIDETGTPPEAVTSTLWSQDIGEFLARGWLDPVSPTVDSLADDIGPLVGEPATVGGEHYVVPHGSYNDTVHYRQDLLAEYGLDPPRTLETLRHNTHVIDEASTDTYGFVIPSGRFLRPFLKLLINAHGGHLWAWDGDEPVVSFPQGPVTEALAFLSDLAQHTPQFEAATWRAYARGNAAQVYFVNGWAAAIAATVGSDRVVETTELVPFPRRAGREPVARNRPGFHGVLAFRDADDRQAVDDVVESLYGNPDQAAAQYGPEPARFLPAWEPVLESEAYQSLDRFQRYPHLLDLLETVRADVAPLAATGDQYVITPATVYAERFDEFYRMAKAVIADGESPEAVAEDTRERLATRLAEGKQLAQKQRSATDT